MIKKMTNKLTRLQKLVCLLVLFAIILLSVFATSSLARYKNRSSLLTAPIWNGNISNSYRSGTGDIDNPYIISNGEELAYFGEQLSTNDYENTYFALKNDIILNKGTFDYDDTNGIRYIVDNQIYYVDEYTNKYYSDIAKEGDAIGTVNTLNPLKSFKGTFMGSLFTIYGLYMTDDKSDEIALFTGLEGSINDLYIENALIYGGNITAGIASTISNGIVKNVLFDGKVIGNINQKNKNISIPNFEVSLNNEKLNTTIDVLYDFKELESQIMSTTLTGNYIVSDVSQGNEVETTINGTIINDGSFSISLGNTLLSTIPLTVDTNTSATVTLLNLSYNITYKSGITSGIIGMANQTSLINVINKADIFGFSISSGLIGVASGEVTINRSYNVGDIRSEKISGGLIGVIENNTNNVSINESYNNALVNSTIKGGIIGRISNNTKTVFISNVFDTSLDNYCIGTITNTIVDISNSYFVSSTNAIQNGVVTNNFILTSINNLNSRTFFVNDIVLGEFKDIEDLIINESNVWILSTETLPILYIDDISSSIVSINTNIKIWNNLSYALNYLPLNLKTSFSITPSDETIELESIYYFISNGSVPLSYSEIINLNNWNIYTDIIEITEEGTYIIYAKAIDYEGNVTYVNSDVLVLDLINMNINNRYWADIKTDLDYVYINKEESINIIVDESLLGIKSIEYYIANDVLSDNELNSITWNSYNNNVVINEQGTYVVYAKIIDNSDNVMYINTDYIVYKGYNEAGLIIGRNETSYANTSNYITNKSTVSLKFNYTSVYPHLIDYTHNLMSNILLPNGTKIVLFDHITNKIYEYRIINDDDIYNYNNSCDINDLDCVRVATYPLTLFKEVGTINTNKNFVESSYVMNGEVSENFTVVLDFSNTNIESNYENVFLYMQINNGLGEGVISTLDNTIKKFNIYSTINDNTSSADLYLIGQNITNSVGNNVLVTTIDLTTGLDYKRVNDKDVIDTTYEDQTIGLRIKIVDEDNNVVSRNQLKNFTFEFNNLEYYLSEDNHIYINLDNDLRESSGNLSVAIYETGNTLEPGNYYLLVNSYVSYNKNDVNKLIDNELRIPINIGNNVGNTLYTFDVNEINNKHIIDKSNQEESFNFNILLNGSFSNPVVRISLYQKNELTAYNQDYTVVDLKEYFSNEITEYSLNKYNIDNTAYRNFQLNPITNSFENTGYKFVFELYDNDIKIGSIEKYFIAK